MAPHSLCCSPYFGFITQTNQKPIVERSLIPCEFYTETLWSTSPLGDQLPFHRLFSLFRLSSPCNFYNVHASDLRDRHMCHSSVLKLRSIPSRLSKRIHVHRIEVRNLAKYRRVPHLLEPSSMSQNGFQRTSMVLRPTTSYAFNNIRDSSFALGGFHDISGNNHVCSGRSRS